MGPGGQRWRRQQSSFLGVRRERFLAFSGSASSIGGFASSRPVTADAVLLTLVTVTLSYFAQAALTERPDRVASSANVCVS